MSLVIRGEWSGNKRKTVHKLHRDIAPVGSLKKHDIPKHVQAYVRQVSVKECRDVVASSPPFTRRALRLS